MRKTEILKNYTLNRLDDETVFIRNNHFNFSFTVADKVLKPEYKGMYRYFGGLQCNFRDDSQEYKQLEQWLCEIAEFTLGVKPPF